jgi:hypothetical protein
MDKRKGSRKPLMTTIFGTVVSLLLASCSGGGAPAGLPAASSGTNVGTDQHPWPRSTASSAPSTKPSSTPIAKAPAATPTPVPAAAPLHVQDFAFYAEDDVNTNVPASFMAANVDIVEGEDDLTFPASRAFKAAGGKTAIAYTDPSLVPYCAAPVTEPAGACDTPMGRLLTNVPSAFLHDSTGARINDYVDSHFLYQEMLNPASPAARSAYAQYVAGIRAAQPQLDGVFADDSGDSLADDFYGMSAPASVEITTDAQWQAAMNGMLAAPGVNVIYNGGAVNSGAGPAYADGEFINQPEVIGQMIEGCFAANGALRTDLYSRFQYDADQNLNVHAYHKLAICMPTGALAPAGRLYVYAGFMLTYDPQYSVYGMDTVLSDGYAVYPETQLVPQQPLKSASSDVGTLRNGNVYVREFASCAIASSSIGGCVALVNSSASSATIPALTQSYAHSIVLDSQSLYGGGKAHVVAGTPSSLAPGSAAILVR